MAAVVPVGALLLEELGHGVDVDKVDHCQDVLRLAAWNAFAIGEQLAALVLDILKELPKADRTGLKGEKASPLALGVL